jgi:hypothetical protein
MDAMVGLAIIVGLVVLATMVEVLATMVGLVVLAIIADQLALPVIVASLRFPGRPQSLHPGHHHRLAA